MKILLPVFLMILSVSAFARVRILHSCSAICLERAYLLPGGSMPLPAVGQSKSVIVTALAESRVAAVDKLNSKCRDVMNNANSGIAAGINYSITIRAEGQDVVDEYVAIPYGGSHIADHHGETANLNCDSIKL